MVSLLISSCSADKSTKSIMENRTIIEVTTFSINSDVDPLVFSKRDAQVEADFTSKQPGFIKRQSGVDDEGNYVVVVYWKKDSDAEHSMSKFMSDATVSDYAKMIDGPSMKMARYAVDKPFDAEDSRFIEVMTFNVMPDTDMNVFDVTNQRVETDFTGKREGFLQRLTGVNDSGRQLVAVYWSTKELSDASLQPFMEAPIAKEFMQSMDQSSMTMGRYKILNMELTNKEKVAALLNSFNTGNTDALAYINPDKYIQHNLSVPTGYEAFAGMVKNFPPGEKAKVIRVFQDENYVFAHMQYSFMGPQAGFDVFRFEDGLIVEHWDNLLAEQPVNPSGRTQFDGATDITDKEKTASNKEVVKDLLENVFMKGKMDKIATYINPTNYVQHNPNVADGLDGLGSAMKAMAEKGMMMQYDKIHNVLGEGNFVLSMSEGKLGKQPTAYYDLFRLENGQIVEHWDVIAAIPPQVEWKNKNGKF